jgi:hypothetical protein
VFKKHYTQLITTKQIKWKNFAIFNLFLTDINNINYCTTLLLTLFIPQINKKCYKYYYLLNTTFSKNVKNCFQNFVLNEYYNITIILFLHIICLNFI